MRKTCENSLRLKAFDLKPISPPLRPFGRGDCRMQEQRSKILPNDTGFYRSLKSPKLNTTRERRLSLNLYKIAAKETLSL